MKVLRWRPHRWILPRPCAGRCLAARKAAAEGVFPLCGILVPSRERFEQGVQRAHFAVHQCFGFACCGWSAPVLEVAGGYLRVTLSGMPTLWACRCRYWVEAGGEERADPNALPRPPRGPSHTWQGQAQFALGTLELEYASCDSSSEPVSLDIKVSMLAGGWPRSPFPMLSFQVDF